ncbi:SDR family NAD(P)-dependent oxidoreductase [Nocardia carnea]|uniref:SDR family NAD(P)-dependent oxidoreductase n=1 Tax=Nocardia carnea TaxID=37328 RepID=UPI002455EB6F|nr:SDR family NAD(P)-dependent oxidoreductase [Nocardia carnea]
MIRVLDTVLDRTLVLGHSRPGFQLRARCWTSGDPPARVLLGRTALVTGADTEIGRSIATRLAALGASTVLAVGDVDRGARARREIRIAVPSADIRVVQCDVAEPDNIDGCCTVLNRNLHSLDVLVHAGGVMPYERTENSSGHEMTLATNVLGPLRLIDRLTPLLTASGTARTVFVASGGMYAQPLPVADPEYRRGVYRGAVAYARAKRMQVAFTPLLDHLLADRGISVHSMHPGWVGTPGTGTARRLFGSALRPVLRTSEQGADTAVWLAATRQLPMAGHFWHDRRIRGHHYLRSTRYTEEQLLSLWAYCLNAAGAGPGIRAGHPPHRSPRRCRAGLV